MKKSETENARRKLSYGVGIRNEPAPQPKILEEKSLIGYPNEVMSREKWDSYKKESKPK